VKRGQGIIIDIEAYLDYAVADPCDVLLQVEAAAMADQHLLAHDLRVTSAVPLGAVPGEESIGQRTWARADGTIAVAYTASVELNRATPALTDLAANDPFDLPALVVPYLMPSRYCESERFEAFVHREFGGLIGGARIEAMLGWISEHVDYVAGVSDAQTTASHTFVQRQGVCRDFAHLMASFARASTIPARLVSGYSPGVDPPDFHAVVEVWLEDGWHLIDATGMARPDEIVRVAVGRDATDIAFMTIFGRAVLQSQTVKVTRRGDTAAA